jgi:U3 small nucleolar RNA-associated protein 11
MSATAFKNAVRRREHYERSQPAARRKYGLLEKHKDYVQRARNFHDKERRLTALRKKASNRNEDEFYFKMARSGTKDGVHTTGAVAAAAAPPAMTPDLLKMLKTQDRSYVTTRKAQEDAQIGRLQSSLHLLGAAPAAAGAHIVFVDDADAQAAFEPAAYFDTAPELVGRAFNRPRTAALEAGEMVAPLPKGGKRRLERARDASYAELEERLERSAKLGSLGRTMDVQAELRKKGRRVKVADAAGDAPAVFKWKTQRKK